MSAEFRERARKMVAALRDDETLAGLIRREVEEYFSAEPTVGRTWWTEVLVATVIFEAAMAQANAASPQQTKKQKAA